MGELSLTVWLHPVYPLSLTKPATTSLASRPDEIAELHPLVDTTGLLGGIYNTGDGHIDPTSVTNVLAAAARSRGAKIFRHNPVEGLTQVQA